MQTLRYLIIAIALITSSALQAEWTSSFSEEGRSSSQRCPNGSALRGIQCTGRYCDNLSLYCDGNLGGVLRSWSERPISEENRGGQDTENGIVIRANGNMQRCGTNGYITGMRCTGSYCDNISLQCSQLQNQTPTNCRWTTWVSEENGGRLVFRPNQYAVAMECHGRYCDNKRFLTCN